MLFLSNFYVILSLSLTTLPLFSPNALSEDSRPTPTFQDQMRDLSVSIPNILLTEKIETLGDLKLKSLIEDLKTVSWEKNSSGFFSGSGKQRESAIYLIEEKKVIFNEMSLAWTPASLLPFIALHEAMGALGYLDENYERSLGLFFYSSSVQKKLDIDTRDWISPLFTRMTIRKKDQEYLAEGGASSVGGGGGAAALEVKIALLTTSKFWLETQQRNRKFEKVKIKDLFLSILQCELNEDFRVNAKKLVYHEATKSFQFGLVPWLNMSRYQPEEKINFLYEVLNLTAENL